MPTQPGFDLHTVLVCPDRTIIVQGGTMETHSGDIYTTQDDGRNVHITRFQAQGSYLMSVDAPAITKYGAVDQMKVRDAGHGDLTFDVEKVGDDICPSFIDHDKDLWRIPYQPGQSVLLKGRPLANNRLPIRNYDGTVLVRRYVPNDRNKKPYHFYGPPKPGLPMRGQGTKAALDDADALYFRVAKYGWIQGYAYDGGILYTLRGSPELKGGFLYADGTVKPYIERRRAIENLRGELLEHWHLDDLGRDEAGHPIDGKTEPEVLFVALWEGKPCLFVGISTGTHAAGNYSIRLYRKEL